MVKRTLFFSNPAYLSMRNEQLVIRQPKAINQEHTVPIEDIGIMILENSQITITSRLVSKLMESKTVIIHCNAQHLPVSLLQPLTGHTTQTERIRQQIAVSDTLKANIWKQTISHKIQNQANYLFQKDAESREIAHKLYEYAKEVKSNDATNREAIAAAAYWKQIYKSEKIRDFRREPQGKAPNNLLNYGYAILRAITARAIVGTGLLPMFGIFHRNKYNAFCLADDIMEPYRIYVDVLVGEILEKEESFETLTSSIKQTLLKIAAMDVVIDGKNSPLMVAMSRTTDSLYECFVGKRRKMLYPILDPKSFQNS